MIFQSHPSNSHTFLKHRTTHKILENGDREYRLYLDGKCIKRALLKKGSYELTSLEPKEGYVHLATEHEELSKSL